jgi:hypothetical protein
MRALARTADDDLHRSQSINDQYRCRDHVSPAKEEELKTREKALGLPLGGLR